MQTTITRILLLAASLGFTPTSQAALLTFTDQALFFGALPGSPTTLDFDGESAGATSIANGGTLGGIRFNYDFGGVEVEVTDGNQFDGGGPFPTTSGANFLGTDDRDLFQDGDDLSLTLGPVNAIGLFFISADPMLDNDITLSAGGTSVGLNALSGIDLGGGSFAFFLGIVDTMNPFTSAEIIADGGSGGPYFLYNIDDITTAVVPIPASLWLFAAALPGLFTMRSKVV